MPHEMKCNVMDSPANLLHSYDRIELNNYFYDGCIAFVIVVGFIDVVRFPHLFFSIEIVFVLCMFHPFEKGIFLFH